MGAVERRFDDLREADRDAFRIAASDLSRRLTGFPEMYATKQDMADAARTLQRLERDSLPREIYDQKSGILTEAVAAKLSAAIFQAFAENYRIDAERNAAEHDDFVSQEYYDERHGAVVEQVASVQAWQYKLVGGLVFATFVAPLITGVLVYLFTTGAL